MHEKENNFIIPFFFYFFFFSVTAKISVVTSLNGRFFNFWQIFHRNSITFPSIGRLDAANASKSQNGDTDSFGAKLKSKFMVGFYSRSAHNLHNDKRFMVFVHFACVVHHWLLRLLLLLLLLERRNFIENNKIQRGDVMTFNSVALTRISRAPWIVCWLNARPKRNT